MNKNLLKIYILQTINTNKTCNYVTKYTHKLA